MNQTHASHRAAACWSGGKDSCLALLRAADAGLSTETLLTMVDPGGLSKSHSLPPELIDAQAAAMRMRSVSRAAGIADYAAVFGEALATLRDEGHTHLVFGDIDLQAHRDWLEPVARRAGLAPVFPLWGMPREAVAREILDREIRATVVCVDTRWLDSRHCGVEYDAAFLAMLPKGVCPCGEDGEFHTFVWDAPCFAHPLAYAAGTQRRIRSAPPFAPTEFVLQTPRLVED